jgi:hypothetical protein
VLQVTKQLKKIVLNITKKGRWKMDIHNIFMSVNAVLQFGHLVILNYEDC